MTPHDDPVSATPVHEPPDLADLDEDDQCREVYAWAGLAMYFAQVFEQSVIHTTYAARVVDGTLVQEFSSADDYYEMTASKPLGPLLARLRNHVELPADIDAHCSDAHRLRNFLIHHFFSDRIELFGHQDGRQLMLGELHGSIQAFAQADKELEQVMFRLGERFGLTRDVVNTLFTELHENWAPGGRSQAEIVAETMDKLHNLD